MVATPLSFVVLYLNKYILISYFRLLADFLAKILADVHRLTTSGVWLIGSDRMQGLFVESASTRMIMPCDDVVNAAEPDGIVSQVNLILNYWLFFFL